MSLPPTSDAPGDAPGHRFAGGGESPSMPAADPGDDPASAGYGEPARPPGPKQIPRRRALVVALIAAIVGVAVGASAILLSRRGGGVTEIHVDTATAPGGGDLVAAGKALGPSVGTVIAGLSGGRFAEGSGFVIGHTGGASDLLTNNHVVDGAVQLHVVMPSGRNLTATLVGADKVDDLAIVSVPAADLPVATFGDSARLQVGQRVVAIGSPAGNVGSVTAGVISALHRTISASSQGSGAAEPLEDVLQTDAAINLGNSGGPLADTSGRVVGVVVALEKNGNANIGYTIPGNLARRVAEDLITHHPVDHPFLGVAFQTSVQAVEAGHGFDGAGVYVVSIQPDSPAAEAGFQPGDVLVAIAGKDIVNGETVGGLITELKVGDPVQFRVRRGGQLLILSATIKERPAALTPAPIPTP